MVDALVQRHNRARARWRTLRDAVFAQRRRHALLAARVERQENASLVRSAKALGVDLAHAEDAIDLHRERQHLQLKTWADHLGADAVTVRFKNVDDGTTMTLTLAPDDDFERTFCRVSTGFGCDADRLELYCDGEKVSRTDTLNDFYDSDDEYPDEMGVKLLARTPYPRLAKPVVDGIAGMRL